MMYDSWHSNGAILSQRRLHVRRDSARRLPTDTTAIMSRPFRFTPEPFHGLFGCLFLSLCTFLQPRLVCFQHVPASFAKRGGMGVVMPSPCTKAFSPTSVFSSFACPPPAGPSTLCVSFFSYVSFAPSFSLFSTSSIYIAKKRTTTMLSPNREFIRWRYYADSAASLLCG